MVRVSLKGEDKMAVIKTSEQLYARIELLRDVQSFLNYVYIPISNTEVHVYISILQ